VFSAHSTDAGVISNENINWIDGNCVVTGTSVYTCATVSGIFTQTPNCQVGLDRAVFSNRHATYDYANSTADSLIFRTNGSGATAQADPFNISCQKAGVDAVQLLKADQTNRPWRDAGAITITGTTSNPTKGTTSVDKILCRRNGENAEIRLEFRQTTAGTTGTGDYLFAIPSVCGAAGINTDLVTAYSTVEGIGTQDFENAVGVAAGSNGSSTFSGVVTVYDSTNVRFQVLDTAGGQGAMGSGFYPLNDAQQSFVASFSVPISGWKETMNAPFIVGSVVTSHDGVIGTESATIENSGSPTVSNEIGNWIDSLTDDGTGQTTVNFVSGTFSAEPVCVPQNADSSSGTCWVEGVISSSAVQVQCVNSGFSAADRDFSLMCKGPR
jgi:hypothetical protein